MKKVLFLTVFIAFLFVFVPVVPAHAANTSVRIAHWMDYHCTQSTPTYYGDGCDVVWSPVEGASGYYVKTFLGWTYDLYFSHPDHVRGVGGGSTNGTCGNSQSLDSRLSCLGYGPFFEVYAIFPNDSGNLKIDKMRTGKQGFVVPGQQVEFKITYKNVGTGTIDEAIITDSIPPYLTWVAGGQPQADGTIQWAVSNIGPGKSGFVTLVLRLDANIPPTVTNIYNMVVSTPPPGAPTPPPDKNPDGFSPPEGAAVSHCDYLVNQGSSGDATWLNSPDITTYQPLNMLDEIKNHDIVAVSDGYASFKHTVATGELLISNGGFTMTTCEDLTVTPKVLSQINLTGTASAQHSVSGIMNSTEIVEVKGKYLTVQIHEGSYTLFAEDAGETVTVGSGKVVVIDPRKGKHTLTAGKSYSWSASKTNTSAKTIIAGPRLVSTSPSDKTSVSWGSFSVTYTFDQPVVSIGPTSRFGISKSHSRTQGFSGTLADLTSSGAISLSWNGNKDALTINVSQSAGIDNSEEALFLSLHLEDVTGNTYATPVLDKILSLFLVGETTGTHQVYFDRFYYRTTVPTAYTMSLKMLDALPGPPPKGFYQVSPAYQFSITHDYTGVIESQVYLGSSTRAFLPRTTTGLGLYRWDGLHWDMVCEGCGGTFDGRGYPIGWFGTVNGITDKNFTAVLFSKMIDPQAPKITSMKLAPGKALPTSPLVIKVKAPLGIDQSLTEVFVDGVQQYSYDPGTDSASNWTIEELNGVTTMTYAGHPAWPKGKVLKGTVKVYGRYGLLSTSGAFSFKVP